MTENRPIRNRDTCGARTRSGGRCRRPAGWGTGHAGTGACKLHGGSTTNHVRSAARRLAETEARDLLARLGTPPPLGHPVDELLAVAAEARAWQAVLRERVAALGSVVYLDAMAVERERALVTLYCSAIDRTARILATLARHDLLDRQVTLDATRDRIAVEAIIRTMVALGIDTPENRVIVGTHLRALEGA